jgi:hypothetical protein
MLELVMQKAHHGNPEPALAARIREADAGCVETKTANQSENI